MILDILVIAIVGIFIYWGLKKGLAKAGLKMISSILSIVIGILLYKPLTNIFYSSPLGEWAQGIAAKIVGDKTVNSPDLSALPTFMQEFLQEGADTVAQNAQMMIYDAVARIIVAIMSLVFVIIAVKLILIIVFKIVGTTTKLPIIKQIDALLGAIVCCVIGMIVVYLVLAVLTVLIPLDNFAFLNEQLNNSNIASQLYNNNLLLKIFMK